MEKSVEPVFFEYITNIGEKKICETELKRIAMEFKRIAMEFKSISSSNP